jgi:hypothetical protein
VSPLVLARVVIFFFFFGKKKKKLLRGVVMGIAPHVFEDN